MGAGTGWDGMDGERHRWSQSGLLLCAVLPPGWRGEPCSAGDGGRAGRACGSSVLLSTGMTVDVCRGWVFASSCWVKRGSTQH